MTVSIALVIPSVNRPDVLASALRSAAEHGQGRIEVLVVAREDDMATQEVARSHGARVVSVSVPGLAHAMQAGARATLADVVAFTDDDAELLPGWLDKLEQHYSDPKVGAVGGRDVQVDAPADNAVDLRVGTVRWNGHVVGGHHTAIGPPRDVDHLKGVNCSFRRALFTGLDASALISGQGAQSRNELAPCLWLSVQGHRIVFDPALQVLHSPAPRSTDDERGLSAAKIYEATFNETLAFHLTRHPRRWTNALLLALLGYRTAPGLARLVHGATPKQVSTTVRAVVAGVATASRERERTVPTS